MGTAQRKARADIVPAIGIEIGRLGVNGHLLPAGQRSHTHFHGEFGLFGLGIAALFSKANDSHKSRSALF